MIRWMLIGAVLAATALGADAAPPPVEAFGRLPALSGADMSLDGTRLLSIATIDGVPLVAVRELDRPDAPWTPVMRGDAKRFRVEWCRFKTRDRIVCLFQTVDFVAGIPLLATRLVAVDADGRNSRQLMTKDLKNAPGDDRPARYQGNVVSFLRDDPENILVAVDHDYNGTPSVFRVNVNTGRMQSDTAGRKPITTFYADRKGVVRLASGIEGAQKIWFVRDGEGKQWRELERYKAYSEESVAFFGLGDDPRQLYVLKNHEGRDALWQVDLADRDNPKLVYAHPSVDVAGPVVWNDALVGASYEGERPEVYWLDADARARFASLRQPFPGLYPAALRTSTDGSKTLLALYSDRQPLQYAVVDTAAGRAWVVAASYPELKPDQLATMKSITYKARDGTVIHGYLTVPDGVPVRGLPLVVMPHGGPEARDSWGFDYLQQFLVSRGYAVLQMDFRGSSGYGSAWFGAAFQDWGGLTYDDVIDGVRWAVDRQIADPARVAVVGASFGGYIALVAAARDSAMFRCSVSIAGLSDLNQLRSYEDLFRTRAISRLQIGSDSAKLRSNSPRRLVDGVTIPILLFHGTADLNVPAAQSKSMSDALRRAGKPHDLVIFEDETHYFESQANRVAMLRRIEAFLAAHLGPPAVPAAGNPAGGGH